jgi:hypothetical protein
MDSEQRKEMAEAFLAFVDLMARLRAPDGCPWDRTQTLQTLKTYVIEEAYEVARPSTRGPPKRSGGTGDRGSSPVPGRSMEEQGAFDREVCREAGRIAVAPPPTCSEADPAQDAEEALTGEKGKRGREGRRPGSGELPARWRTAGREKVRSVGVAGPSRRGGGETGRGGRELKAPCAGPRSRPTGDRDLPSPW